MKKSFLFAVFFLMLSVLSPLHGADQTTIFPNQARIRVQYQARRPDNASWTMYSTTLTDALSESMLVNQLLKRHPGYEVRVLSASADGKTVSASVRCQIRRGIHGGESDRRPLSGGGGSDPEHDLPLKPAGHEKVRRIRGNGHAGQLEKVDLGKLAQRPLAIPS